MKIVHTDLAKFLFKMSDISDQGQLISQLTEAYNTTYIYIYIYIYIYTCHVYMYESYMCMSIY